MYCKKLLSTINIAVKDILMCVQAVYNCTVWAQNVSSIPDNTTHNEGKQTSWQGALEIWWPPKLCPWIKEEMKTKQRNKEIKGECSFVKPQPKIWCQWPVNDHWSVQEIWPPQAQG